MSSEGSQAQAVAVRGLSKKYKIYASPFRRIREALTFGHRKYHKEVWALRDIDFELSAGRALGVVGSNGAGKSTLLKILSGTSLPTTGRFDITGRISSLLELGAGFHTDFTGRDNIFLNASVMGFSRRETRAKLAGIIEFTELGHFIDQPVRTYSSGMAMRLGFSVATAIDPDILIIDEILAVGDMHFQKKCIDRIFDFRNKGKTIILCSHSLYDIRQVSDEVLWIKDGRVEMYGDPQEVTTEYANYERSLSKQTRNNVPEVSLSDEVDPPRIDQVLVFDQNGAPAEHMQTGQPVTMVVDYHAPEGWHGIMYCAFAIWRSDNVLIAVASSGHDKVKTPCRPGGHHRAMIDVPRIPLVEGEFTVAAYLYDENCIYIYDHRMCDRTLRFTPKVGQVGVISLGHTWRFEDL